MEQEVKRKCLWDRPVVALALKQEVVTLPELGHSSGCARPPYR
jgi:hypothetical protein